MADKGIVAVPSKKVIQYQGGLSITQDQLAVDVTNYTRNQVIELLRKISASETERQVAIDNPPDLLVVDKTRNKPISQAVRRVQVMFGTALRPEALTVLKSLLAKAIARSTDRRSGALANVAANWDFVFVRDGKASAVPVGTRQGISMRPSDAIVLRPSGVPHATVANIRASQKRTRARDAKRAAKGKAAGRRAATGFLAQTTAAARRQAVFKGFKVVVRWTRHVVRGELWKRGLTGTIMITPDTGRGARSRRR
jgi:hypothetical protein